LASPSPESVAIAIDSFARYLFGPGADGCDRDLGLAVPSPHQCGRGDWRVRFFIANDMAPEEAPLPSSDALRLVREPGRLIAALAHDPKASGRMVHANRRKLQETIRATRRYELEDASDWASYDAPFALPFCQRAETLTEVREASASEAGLIWELMTRRGSRAA
ncbi:MAG: heme-binding protein, partial [Myxococcales bacterium]|nr:heme-binding protein [Myxococcales bacterium]